MQLFELQAWNDQADRVTHALDTDEKPHVRCEHYHVGRNLRETAFDQITEMISHRFHGVNNNKNPQEINKQKNKTFTDVDLFTLHMDMYISYTHLQNTHSVILCFHHNS
jgi:hypothetical protein